MDKNNVHPNYFLMRFTENLCKINMEMIFYFRRIMNFHIKKDIYFFLNNVLKNK